MICFKKQMTSLLNIKRNRLISGWNGCQRNEREFCSHLISLEDCMFTFTQDKVFNQKVRVTSSH
jgi:hypothetical protein